MLWCFDSRHLHPSLILPQESGNKEYRQPAIVLFLDTGPGPPILRVSPKPGSTVRHPRVGRRKLKGDRPDHDPLAIPAGVEIRMGKLPKAIMLFVVASLLLVWASGQEPQTVPTKKSDRASQSELAASEMLLKTAIFAGGCFWCMEPPFDARDGVLSTTSGYTGGHLPNPSYTQVSAGRTGHAEAVEIRFDPMRISYEELVDVFWHNIDPLARNRQFCDTGSQYRSAVFYQDDDQKGVALASKRKLEQSGLFTESIVTEIVAATTFYPAEEYHQNYYMKNPLRYKFYRYGCGRDRRLEELWGNS